MNDVDLLTLCSCWLFKHSNSIEHLFILVFFLYDCDNVFSYGFNFNSEILSDNRIFTALV